MKEIVVTSGHRKILFNIGTYELAIFSIFNV